MKKMDFLLLKKSIVPPAPKILGNIKENLDSIVRGRSSPVKNLTRKRQEGSDIWATSTKFKSKRDQSTIKPSKD